MDIGNIEKDPKFKKSQSNFAKNEHILVKVSYMLQNMPFYVPQRWTYCLKANERDAFNILNNAAESYTFAC